MAKKKLAILASGKGTNLQAIINACNIGYINANISVVVSDRRDAHALIRAEKGNIPNYYHGWKLYKEKFNLREGRFFYDIDLGNLVKRFNPDVVILAGWMRILSKTFISKFPMKVINLHPALPNQFPGLHAIERAYAASCDGEIDHTGVMVHFVVDEGVDNGPIIMSEKVPIFHDDTIFSLEERIHIVEHRLLIESIRFLTH